MVIVTSSDFIAELSSEEMDVKSVGLPSEIRTSRGLMWKPPNVCDLPKIIKSR